MAQGKKYEIHWDNNDPATPAIIDALLDDWGLGDDAGLIGQIARLNTRKYCMDKIKHEQEDVDYVVTIADLSLDAHPFYDGFLACLKLISEDKLKKCGFVI